MLDLELYYFGDGDFWKYDHICVLGSSFQWLHEEW